MLFRKGKLNKALPAIIYTALILVFSNNCFAQCNNQIGTLNVLNPHHKDGVFICYEDTLQVELTDYELMDSQKLYYVYHARSNVNSLIIDVDTTKTDGFINILSTPPKLYVTAVIGNDKPSSWLKDSCTVFSNTVEFYCLDRVNFDIDVDAVSRKEYIVRVQATGGMPEFDNTYKYFLTGNINDVLRIDEIARFNVELSSRETFNMYIIDANGCTTKPYSEVLESSFQFPITLLSFYAQIEGTNHLLNWATASEINSDYFVLEVSKNGGDFVVLDSIKGAGTTSQTNRYSFINENLIPGTYLYRLSQVDFEGEVELLGVFELESYAVHAFPNPTNNYLSFHFSGAQFNNLEIQIFDSTGKKVLSFNDVKLRYYRHDFTIDVSSLTDGIYFAQIHADNFKRVEKFIVEK